MSDISLKDVFSMQALASFTAINAMASVGGAITMQGLANSSAFSELTENEFIRKPRAVSVSHKKELSCSHGALAIGICHSLKLKSWF